MVKVRVLVDGFKIGLTTYAKGSVFEVSEPAANYMVGQKTCERATDTLPEDVKPKKKAPSRKKATYKTRDIVSGD